MMSSDSTIACETARQVLLSQGLDAESRRQAALAHVAQCEACRKALDEFDQIGAALRFARVDAVPPGGWDGMEKRLLQTLKAREMAPLVGHEHKWRNVMRPSLAVAAVLTLCVGAAAIGFALGRGRPSDSTPAAQSPLASSQPGFKSPVIGVEPAIFSSVEVNQQVQAFQQVNQVFDGKASWLYQSNGESDVGLAASESRNAKSVVWLRLTMRRNGQLASSADLVIVPGGTARLRVPSRQGPAVQYLLSTSANEPTQVSLWAELVAPGGTQTLAALAATLQPKPGQTMAAGQLVTSAGEYDLTVSFAKGGEALP